ncbi:chemotaxis protein CheC [Rheinheimera sediminis]|uniref:chemotaxis protein CheC n=1 Tax=Rheinheimera sp. YQF-1 TaxID=2499626 RepID=UPI000FDAC1CC|nr:chemotaxis protein CheC [Rheinheimera sp. YQF-1]RVT49108.1 chemotaxis protein CheC [Rheinheimera sp. YQF-1]
MSSYFISEEQKDALQEVLNISMGQAADALARLIQTQVHLSIPSIKQSSSDHFIERLKNPDQQLAQQSFLGELSGEMISLMSDGDNAAIAELMNYDIPLVEHEKQELMLELTNILAGACLHGLISQLNFKIQLAAPVLLNPASICIEQLSWQQALLMEICFQIPQSSFNAEILICLKQDSLLPLKNHLDMLLQ